MSREIKCPLCKQLVLGISTIEVHTNLNKIITICLECHNRLKVIEGTKGEVEGLDY